MRIDEATYEDVLKLRHEVMYPNQSRELAKVENDHEGIHLGIYEGEILASAVSIFLKDHCLQFRKLATKKEFQNKGYATSLLRYLIGYSAQFSFEKIWANARVEALPFYQKLGFEQTKETFTKNNHKYVIIEYRPSIQDLEENKDL